MTAPVMQEPTPEKVAMTAPVVQTEGAGGDYVVAFVLPASMTLETAPVPTNPDVRVRAVPERVAAAVAYRGRWTRSAYEHHLDELQDAVLAAGFVPVGPPRFARYDAPFKPWFLRRNEVVQDVFRPMRARAGSAYATVTASPREAAAPLSARQSCSRTPRTTRPTPTVTMTRLTAAYP